MWRGLLGHELEPLFGIPTYQRDRGEGSWGINASNCSPLAKPSWKLDLGGPLMQCTQISLVMDKEWRGAVTDKWMISTRQTSLILYSSPIVIPSGNCQHFQENLMLISLFYYPNVLLNTFSLANSKNFSVDSLWYSQRIVI